MNVVHGLGIIQRGMEKFRMYFEVLASVNIPLLLARLKLRRIVGFDGGQIRRLGSTAQI